MNHGTRLTVEDARNVILATLPAEQIIGGAAGVHRACLGSGFAWALRGDRSVRTPVKPKPALNTFTYTKTDGTEVFRFFATDVVTILPDGAAVLNTDGYRTKTTKERINDILRMRGLRFRLFADKGWRLTRTKKDGTWPKKPLSIRFADGIILGRDGSVTLPQGVRDTDKLRSDLDERIVKYSKLVAETLRKGWLVPDNGDCWPCRLVDEGGVAWGDMRGSTDGHEHLRNHLEEGYVHGSLVWNAYREGNFGNPAVAFSMDGRLDQDGKPRGLPDRYAVRRAVTLVRRYLRKRLLDPKTLEVLAQQKAA